MRIIITSIQSVGFVSFYILSLQKKMVAANEPQCIHRYNSRFKFPNSESSRRELLRCSDLLMTNNAIVCLQVSSISGSVLEMFFKQWDSLGNLQCNSHLNSSHSVYIVQTTGGYTHLHHHKHIHTQWLYCLALIILRLFSSHLFFYLLFTEQGFFGLLSGVSKDLQQLLFDNIQWDSQSSGGSTWQP